MASNPLSVNQMAMGWQLHAVDVTSTGRVASFPPPPRLLSVERGGASRSSPAAHRAAYPLIAGARSHLPAFKKPGSRQTADLCFCTTRYKRQTAYELPAVGNKHFHQEPPNLEANRSVNFPAAVRLGGLPIGRVGFRQLGDVPTLDVGRLRLRGCRRVPYPNPVSSPLFHLPSSRPHSSTHSCYTFKDSWDKPKYFFLKHSHHPIQRQGCFPSSQRPH